MSECCVCFSVTEDLSTRWHDDPALHPVCDTCADFLSSRCPCPLCRSPNRRPAPTPLPINVISVHERWIRAVRSGDLVYSVVLGGPSDVHNFDDDEPADEPVYHDLVSEEHPEMDRTMRGPRSQRTATMEDRLAPQAYAGSRDPRGPNADYYERWYPQTRPVLYDETPEAFADDAEESAALAQWASMRARLTAVLEGLREVD